MKLPVDAEISDDKIVNYLLKNRLKNDKSGFLNKAGYNQSNYHKLIEDIRSQILPLDAEFQRENPYGKIYSIQGSLDTPMNKKLSIITIWFIEYSSNKTKFITLYPSKEK
ncbi:MAG: hypothetical protein HZB41_07300 [Ignavibacteriae bacterium]|nr:hypothetical protein [Ignavibacteriota bacterium]